MEGAEMVLMPMSPMPPLHLLVAPLAAVLMTLLLPRRSRRWQAGRLVAEVAQPVGHSRPPLQGRWRRDARAPSPLPVMS